MDLTHLTEGSLLSLLYEVFLFRARLDFLI